MEPCAHVPVPVLVLTVTVMMSHSFSTAPAAAAYFGVEWFLGDGVQAGRGGFGGSTAYGNAGRYGVTVIGTVAPLMLGGGWGVVLLVWTILLTVLLRTLVPLMIYQPR